MDKKFEIILSFIKDLSIETPDAETLLFVRENIDKYQLGIDISSKPLKNKMIEVSTKLSFRDKSTNEKKSVFEIDYASVVKIDEGKDNIDWSVLSVNKNAENLIKNNLDKISWFWLSENPIIFEIDYASVVKIDEGVNDKKELGKILLCDVQKEVYPELETIFVNLINKSCYPNIKFEKKVDFEKLYSDKLN